MIMVGIPIPKHITFLYVFAVANLIALFQLTFVKADVFVIEEPSNKTIETFFDLPALFGLKIPDEGIQGYLKYANPKIACGKIDPPPTTVNISQYIWIALIQRGGDCPFDEKVLNAEKAGWGAAIVHNVNDERLISMDGNHDLKIYSCFVSWRAGKALGQRYTYSKGYRIKIDGSFPENNFNGYLLPFAIVVGVCFVLMLVFMIGKWIRDIRKKRKSRISKQNLSKIPTEKFKKGDLYDVCAICLDEYEEGDKLRVLPCAHAYHTKCVDPWLLNNKRTCPVCKRKVIPGDVTDSEEETEDDTSHEQSSEITPLLTHGNASRGGTFDNSGLPSAVRGYVLAINTGSSDEEDSSDESNSASRRNRVSNNETQTTHSLQSSGAATTSNLIDIDPCGNESPPNSVSVEVIHHPAPDSSSEYDSDDDDIPSDTDSCDEGIETNLNQPEVRVRDPATDSNKREGNGMV